MDLQVLFYHIFMVFMTFVQILDSSNVTNLISNVTDFNINKTNSTTKENDNLDQQHFIEEDDEKQMTLIDWLSDQVGLNLTEIEEAFIEEDDNEDSLNEEDENLENFNISTKRLIKENLREQTQNLTSFVVENLPTNLTVIQLTGNLTSLEKPMDLKNRLNEQMKKKKSKKSKNKRKVKKKKKRKVKHSKMRACRSHGHNHKRCNRMCRCPCRKTCTTTTTTTSTTTTTTEATSTSEETTTEIVTTEATTVQASTQPARERRAGNSNNINRENTNLVVYTTLCNWKTHLQSKVMRMIYYLNANRPLNYEYYLANLHEIVSSIEGVCSVNQPMNLSMNQQLNTLIRNEQLFNRVGNLLGNFEKAECRLDNYSFPCGQLGQLGIPS